PARAREDHWHAVVECAHQGVCGAGEDRARATSLAITTRRPQAGERHRPAVARADVEALLAAPGLGAPLVEAVGGDQATAARECGAERRAAGDGLGPRVDRPPHAVGTLGRGWH